MKYSVDIKELESMYLDEGLTCRQIGERVNIPFRTILRYLKSAGVKLRNPGDPVIEQLANREWLKARYWDDGKSTTEIANEIGCGTRSVSLWLRRHKLGARSVGSETGHARATADSRRKQSKARRGKYIGSDNPNWKGGIQKNDPDRNRYRSKIWVKAVKDRDGWCCVECGATDNLHAHHIKRWRDYPDLRYELDNGKTLCHPCHEAAHGRGFQFRWSK